MKKNSYSVIEAKTKLQRFCAYRDRCHKEVIEKLREMHMIPEAIDLIVTELIRDNFLNEARFAKSFARGKFRIKKWGKVRIIRELKFRDISKYNIDSALQEIDDSEYLDTLDKLAKKRNASLNESNILKRKKKIADYLLYRGWESHLVYEKINEILSED